MIRDVQKVDDDIVEIKRAIKRILISDPDILEALNNPNIPIDSPDEFLDNNIFGYLRVPKVQDTVRNFICFTVEDVEPRRNAIDSNVVIKKQQIIINVICHLDDMTTEYGIDRHDLLGYLIRDTFNWTNEFGLQFHLLYNKERTVDGDYFCRTLSFQAQKLHSLNKARMSNPYDKLRD